MLRGKIASGQTCESEVECVAGTLCVKPGGVCRGTCSSYSKANEACGFGCAPGLYCEDQGSPDPSDDRCAAAKAAEKPCASSLQCAEDLHCAAGLCKARGKLGEPCGFDADRLSTCEPGLACDVIPFVDGATGTCIRPVAQGGACKFHWSCEAGLVCFDLDYAGFPATAPSLPGSCQPPRPLDTPCLSTPYATYVGDQCAAGSYLRPGAAEVHRGAGARAGLHPVGADLRGSEGLLQAVGQRRHRHLRRPGQRERALRLRHSTRAARIRIPCANGWCDAETTLTCRSANKALGQTCHKMASA